MKKIKRLKINNINKISKKNSNKNKLEFWPLKCWECKHKFQVEKDFQCVITCPYCSAYVEGM